MTQEDIDWEKTKPAWVAWQTDNNRWYGSVAFKNNLAGGYVTTDGGFDFCCGNGWFAKKILVWRAINKLKRSLPKK